MSRTLLIIIIISSFCSVARGQWESIGPYGGYMGAIDAAASSENILYASSYTIPSRIFKSTDYGDSWTYLSSLSNYVYSLKVDPTNSNIIYLGSDGAVHKSTDGGINWNSYPVQAMFLNGLEIHPTSTSIIFAAGMMTGGSWCMGFFKSTDSGVTWTSLTLHDSLGWAQGLALDPSNPNTIYVGGAVYHSSTSYPKVFKSIDGGSNFTDISDDFPTSCNVIYSLAVHPTNSNIAYAGTEAGGIYRSTDSGNSWSLVTPTTYRFVYSLATTPANDQFAYAGADTAIYKSTNSGESWFKTGSGFAGSYFQGLVADRTQSSVVYAANNSGIYKTTNGGTNWFISSYGIISASITTFAVCPSSQSTIYAEFSGVGVYKTTNCGNTWIPLPSFLSCGNICAITVHNTDPNFALALEGSG